LKNNIFNKARRKFRIYCWFKN